MIGSDLDHIGPHGEGIENWGWRQDPDPRPENPTAGNTPALAGREKDMTDADMAETERHQAIWRRLIGLYVRELDIQAAWRARMADDEAFYDGDQISDEDAAKMEARGQLPITYNVIAPSVNWILGQERRARAQPRVLARSDQGARSAQRKTELLKYVYDQSQGEMAGTLAYRDQVRAGLGWLESGRQHDDEGEPVYMARESWRNILHDSRAERLDFEDGRFMFRTRWSDTDIARALFSEPEQQANIERSALEGTETFSDFDDYGDAAMDERERYEADLAVYNRSSGDGRRQRVRLIEGWFREPVSTEIIRGGEYHGSIYMPGHPGMEQSLMAGAGIFSRVKMRMHVAIMTVSGLLHIQESPYVHNKFPFTPFVGNIKAATGEPYGIIRNLKDIQIDVNRRAAKALQIISSNKIIMDHDAVDDVDELAEEVARPDAIIKKKKGSQLDLNADRELAPAHMELFSRGIMMIQSIGGVTDENMGRETNAVSGRAIRARQDQGTTATWHYVDNYRYGQRSHGEKMLSLAEQYFTEEKKFRITNTRGTPDYVAINDGLPENDIAATRADYVMSEDEWKATMRQQQVEDLLEVLQQLAPVAPQLVFALLDLLVEAMDIPSKDAIVSRIRNITGMEDPDLDPNAADPETLARREQKKEQAQMHARAANAEISKQEAEAAEKQARAFETNIKGFQAAQTITDNQLSTIARALEVAVEAMGARPAVPAAEELVANAEAITRQAVGLAAQRSSPQPQTPPTANATTPNV